MFLFQRLLSLRFLSPLCLRVTIFIKNLCKNLICLQHLRRLINVLVLPLHRVVFPLSELAFDDVTFNRCTIVSLSLSLPFIQTQFIGQYFKGSCHRLKYGSDRYRHKTGCQVYQVITP